MNVKTLIWLTSFSIFLISPMASAKLLFTSNFENKSLSGWSKQDGDLPGAIMIQDRKVRSGKYAVRLDMKRCSWIDKLCGKKPRGLNRPRAQLGGGGRLRFKPGQEYWIAWSTYVPKDWIFDGTNHDPILSTHRVNNAKGPGTCAPGFYGSQPIGYAVDGSRWELRRQINNPRAKKFGDYQVRQHIGDVKKDQWTDFVHHFKFSYGSDGFHEVWVNGEKKVTYSGSTICPGADRSLNSKTLPYLNWTLYKANWRKSPTSIKTRTLFHDELRVGGGRSSYQEVAPGRRR